MKRIPLFFFVLLTFTSCKKDTPEPPVKEKEKVKLYITATPGVHQTGTPSPILQIFGTNIETVNITGIHIIEVKYPKGEVQTVTVKSLQGNGEIYLEVAKDVGNSANKVAYKMGYGTISVSFTP